MAKKTLVFEVGADYDPSGIRDFRGDLRNLAQEITTAQNAAGDKVELKLEVDVDIDGATRVLDLEKGTKALDETTKKNIRTIREQTKAQEGSIASTRGRLQQAQQELSYMRPIGAAYDRQVELVKDLQRAYDTSRGIQQGSVAVLQREGQRLQELLRTKTLYRTELQQTQDAIRSNNAEQRRAQGIQKDSVKDLQAQRAELRALVDATNKATDPTRWQQLSAELKGVDDKLDALTPASKKFIQVLDNIQRIRATIETVNQAFQILNNTINKFVNRQKQVESFNLALRNIGQSSSEVARSFQQAEQTAVSLGAPLQTIERSYKRIVPSLSALGVSAADSDKFIASLAARTQTLGLNTEEAGRYTEAFAQVLSKGKLSGEELNQQISELDGSFRTQLAQSIGISTAELTNLVETGNVGSGQFVTAFLRMQNGVQALEDNLKNGTATIQQLQNNIATLNTKNIENLGTAFQPLFRAVLKLQENLAKFFNELSKLETLKELGQALAGLLEGFTLLSQTIIKVVTAILPAVDAVAKLVVGFLNAEIAGVSLAKVLGALLASIVGLLARKAIVSLFTGLAGPISAVATAAMKFASANKLVAAGFELLKAKNIGSFVVLFRNLAGVFAGSLTSGIKTALVALRAFSAQLIKLALNPYVALFLAVAFATYKLGERMAATASAAKGFATAAENAKNRLAEFNKVANEDTKIEDTFKPGPLENFSKQLKNQGRLYSENGNAFQKAVGPILGGIGNLVKGVSDYNRKLDNNKATDIFIATADGIKQTDDAISAITVQANKYTGILTKQSNVQGLSNFRLQEGRKIRQAEVASIREQIAAMEKELTNLKKLNPENRTGIKLLEQNIAVRKTILAQQEGINRKLDEEFTRRVLQGQAIGTVTERLQALQGAQSQAAKNISTANTLVEAESYRLLADNIISAEQAEGMRMGSKLGGITATLQLQRTELNLLEQEKAKTGELTGEQANRYAELKTLVAESTNQQAQAYAQVKEAIVNAFAEGIAKNQELADIAIQTAGQIKSAFDAVSGASLSGIQAATQYVAQISQNIQSDIDRRTAARIQALERSGLEGVRLEQAKAQIQAQADAEKKQVLAQELKLKSEMIDIETTIEKIKNRVNTVTAVNEARIAQLRLRAEAQIAAARGENDLAKALYAAADAQDLVIRGLLTESALNDRILDLRRNQSKAALAGQAAAAGIDGFQFGNLKSALADARGFARFAEGATRELEQASIEASNLSVDIEKVSLEKGAEEAKAFAGVVSSAAESTAGIATDANALGRYFNSATQNAANLYQVLSSINSLGGNRRALGGPVSAGSQYLVNDGGGREGFISKSGKFSMLPPGRNINWVAPTSGTVIPANLVNDVKAQFEMTQRGKSLSNKLGKSGNLITHASNVGTLSNSSNSQRIVNHVTIQSTSPVMDASRLMTMVTKAKSRRRI
jgi:tape measure domain-containing protein